MDTTDSKISFDKSGVCDFCRDYYANVLPAWKPQENNPELLKLADRIREAGRDRPYDCILGMSGGVDSSYLCYVAKELMHLKPLALVVDTGWNLDVANENIRTVTEKLGIDTQTIVIDREEMKDLQTAFLKSRVPYQDLPQDHAIFASLYRYAVQNGIPYVLTGANNATEYVRPPIEWVYQNDVVLIKDIQKRFGTGKLKRFPFCGLLTYRLYYPIVKGLKRVAPLNYIPYDKANIRKFLTEQLGWQPYANKHYEDRFTRWYEGYYLPKKFGYDKRKCYLSNLILTGEITREEALEELEKEPYPQMLIREDTEYIAGRLGMTVEQLDSLVNGENKTFEDYRNSFWLIRLGTAVLRFLKLEKKKFH